MSEAKILDSTWFSTMAGDHFGIVIVDAGNEQKKAYIGKATGANQGQDEQLIAQRGTPVDVVHLLNFFKRQEMIK